MCHTLLINLFNINYVWILKYVATSIKLLIRCQFEKLIF